MRITKGEDEEIVVNAEPDANMVTAVGVEEKVDSGGGGGKNNEPPIPPGHSRYYCSKCRSVSILTQVHNIQHINKRASMLWASNLSPWLWLHFVAKKLVHA